MDTVRRTTTASSLGERWDAVGPLTHPACEAAAICPAYASDPRSSRAARHDSLNAELCADVSPDAAAVNVYPVPARLTEHPENVATPFDAATGLDEQLSVAPLVPVSFVMLSVTE